MACAKNVKNSVQGIRSQNLEPNNMRSRRGKQIIAIRKNKREEELQKKRNIQIADPINEEETNTLLLNLTKLIKETAQTENLQIRLDLVDIAQILSDNITMDTLISTEIIPILIHNLKYHDNPLLQLKAARILTDISSGTSEHIGKIVEADAVPLFIQLLSSPCSNVCQQALWALSNILSDKPIFKDYVIDSGILNPLLSLIHPNTEIFLLADVTQIICHLFQIKNPPLSVEAIKQILPVLDCLLHHPNMTILIDTILAFEHLTEIGELQIEMVIDTGVLPKLISLLSHIEVRVQSAALKTLGNIAMGTDEQVQAVLNDDALSHFSMLLTHSDATIRKDALWFLVNVTIESELQVQAVINAGLLPGIKYNLSNGNFLMQKDAVFIVSNLIRIGIDKERVDRIVDEGVIPPYCDMLSCQDVEIIEMILLCILNLLMHSKEFENQVDQVCSIIENCDFLIKIERLRDHNDSRVYQPANCIIEMFFNERTDLTLEPEDVHMN